MPTHPLWLVAGWTMLHFLWVGSAIELATLLIRFVLRSAAPVVRYTLSLIGFAALAVAPIGIAGYLWQQPPSLPVRLTAPAAVPQLPSGQEVYRDEPTIDLADTPLAFEPPLAERQWAPEPAAGAAETTTLPAAPNRMLPNEPLETQLVVLFDRAAAWLPLVWLIGTPLTFLLLATGLIGVERLRKDCRPVTSGPLYEALVAAAERLSISGRTALALSERVAQPMLIGVLRPVVLLPASAASGYSPEQLEMVLLHELAHVRRRDNLVNLGQRVIESLLFFHPAVWLVSRQLRADREQCCDALVVRLTDDPQSYAELLVAVAEQNTPLPLAASAMASHPLARRVRRILQLEDEPMLVSKKFFLAVLAVGLGLTGACGYSFSQGPEAVAEPVTESVEEPDATPEETPAAEPQEVEAETPDQAPGPPNHPHFLSLEDQRIADLAFRMLDIEVAPLDDDQAAAVKEKGFASGLVVTKGTYGRQPSGGPMPQLLIQHGDILVGLHVWPVESFSGLAEVLRRNDLAEFNPLKFYVLRWTPKVETSPRGGTVGYGGGYGGGGGEYGEFGGHSEPPAQPEMTFKLVTGRITFKAEAWQAEQERLYSPQFQSVAPGIDPKLETLPAVPATPAPADDASYFQAPPLVVPEGPVEQLATQLPRSPNAPPPLTKLTYNGRSFEEWNTQWRTELSQEQRIEAVKAFAAFGNAGHGKEATRAILATVPVTPLTGEMQEAYRTAFSGIRGIPYQDWFPLVKQACVDSPDDYGSFAGHLLRHTYYSGQDRTGELHQLFVVENAALQSGILEAMSRVDRDLADPNVVVTFCQALQSDDDATVTFALSRLQERAKQDRLSVSNYATPVYDLLLHQSPGVRRWARRVVAEFPEQRTTEDLADRILKVLPNPEDGGFFGTSNSLEADESPEAARQVQLALVRTLGCLSPSVLSVAEEQLSQFLESDDQELSWAAAVAIDKLDNDQVDGSSREAYAGLLDRQSETLFPGIGAIDADALKANLRRIERTIDKLLKNEINTCGLGGGPPFNEVVNHWYSRMREAQRSENE